ncbi:MAG: glycosyltransferase family 1 protein [Patescibacteria group bacterium]
MKIGIDMSPMEGKGSLYHRVRGTGSYLRNLKESLLRYDKLNMYIFFTRGEKLPKNVDLVHYPYFEPFFLTLPLFNKTPLVVTVHDLTPLVFPKYFPTGLRGNLKWKIQRESLKKAKKIITDSRSSRNDIIKYTGIFEDKIEVVYLAAGEEFRKKNLSQIEIKGLRKKYQLPEKFALYVGDVTWNKNLPRLIEACVKANIPLVLTGKALLNSNFDRKNPWNQDLIKVQELCRVKKNITRIGFVDDEDLVNLYNIAQVFVMPSLYEGFGLPVLEAMSCGCPVITSGEGSLREVAGDAAFYVNAYDVDSILKGIKKVFSDNSFGKELSEKGIEQAKKFSWKKTTEETLKVYESI